MPRKHVIIYTDGACSGNPGPGGWGCVLMYGEHTLELHGGESSTTNNRMELTAVIRAVEALKVPCEIELHSDSSLVVNGWNSWLEGWKRKDWRTTSGPVANRDLWERLDEAVRDGGHAMTMCKAAGHSGDPLNDRCDALARLGTRENTPQ